MRDGDLGHRLVSSAVPARPVGDAGPKQTEPIEQTRAGRVDAHVLHADLASGHHRGGEQWEGGARWVARDVPFEGLPTSGPFEIRIEKRPRPLRFAVGLQGRASSVLYGRGREQALRWPLGPRRRGHSAEARFSLGRWRQASSIRCPSKLRLRPEVRSKSAGTAPRVWRRRCLRCVRLLLAAA